MISNRWFLLVTAAACLAAGCKSDPARAGAKYLDSGKARLGRNDYARAILDLRNAARLLSQNPEPFYQLGLAYNATGDARAAAQFFRKTVELEPRHVGAQVKLAELMISSGNKDAWIEATDRAKKALAIAPTDAEALHALAIAELRLGKPEDAIAHLQQALEVMPQHLKSSVSLAKIRLAARDFPAAERVLKNAVVLAPKSSSAALALGRFYVLMRKPVDAEREFLRAVELDPESGPAVLDLASLYSSRGNKGEAEKLYKRLSALPDDNYRSAYARYLLESGQQDAAIAEYERLSARDPNSRQARTSLLMAYIAARRLGDAQRILTRALDRNPKDNEALEQRAQLLLVEGKPEQAERDLREVVRSRPDSATARYWLAKTQQAAGSIHSYQQELAQALELDPRLLSARIELSQAMRAGGDASGARSLMDKSPEDQRESLPVITERNWALWELHDDAELRKRVDQGMKEARTSDLLAQDGLLKFRQRQYEPARTSLNEALTANPENIAALQALASSYVAQGQNATSVDKVRAHVAIRPKSPRLQLFLGELLETLGNDKESYAAFQAAKSADSGFVSADLAMARLDVKAGRYDAARERLSRLASGNGSSTAHLLLGFLEESSTHYPEAIAHYRQVVQSDPHNVIALNNLAFALADHANQFDEALRYAQQAKELEPQSAAIEDTLGWAYYRKGMYQASLSHLKNSSSKEPTATRMYHLAMAYHKLGDAGQARRSFQAALSLNPGLPEAELARATLARP